MSSKALPPDPTSDRMPLALKGADAGVWAWDLTGDVLRWSEQVGPLHGLPEHAQPGDYGAYLDAALHPDDRAALDAAAKQALATGEAYTQEYRVALPDGTVRWLVTRAHVLHDAGGKPVELIGLTYDVTERRRRDEATALLAQASESLGQSLDPFRTLRGIARLAVPGRADWCAVHVLRDDGHIDTVAVAHADPARGPVARAVASRYPPLPTASTGAAHVIRTGQSEIYERIDDEQLRQWAREAEQLELLRELEVRSSMTVPLLAGERALGAITFIYTESGRRYSEGDLEVAEELGRRAGVALENARLYERQHRTAETLQRALLPRSMPVVPGYEMVPGYFPGTEGDEAGGDWYDAFLLPDGRLALVIGDVVGHGMEAAATMGQVRNSVRAYAVVEPDPGRVIDLVGEMARALGNVTFATVAYVALEPASGALRCASAGHLPPLVVSADGATRFLAAPVVPPLATLRQVPCSSSAAALEPGDTLLLYTDGLVEHRHRDLDAGMKRLAELAVAPLPLAELVPRLTGEMTTSESRDDVAILAVRRQR